MDVLILPTYCEAENLPTLIPAILSVSSFDVLVVDDGSTDGTQEIVRRFAQSSARVQLLERTVRTGLGDAYRAGMRRALQDGAQTIATMDADWSHDPAILPTMVEASRSGADLVIGSRYVAGGAIANWSPWRRFLSRSAKRAARLVIGTFCFDFTSGYRLYRRAALEKVPPESVQSSSYSFLLEMATLIQRAGLTIAEVPIRFEDRRGGVSKMPSLEIIRAVSTLLRLRFQRERGR